MTATDELLLGTRAVALPRVNLLPPEIEAARTFRKVQLGLGAAVLSAVAAVGAAYLLTSGELPAARSSLAAATAEKAALSGRTATYAGVTAVYTRAASEQAMLTGAMGDEIRYSQLLDDLTRTVPAHVWLKTLAFTGTVAGAASVATAAPPAAGSSAAVATMTVTGIGFTHDDVAAWLLSLSGQKTYTSVVLASSSEALVADHPTVGFSTTATVTGTARSGRYTTPAGG